MTVSSLDATCGAPATRTLRDGVPWWRPLTPKQSSTVVTTTAGNSVAFVALISFTVILLLSPQANHAAFA